MSNAAMEAPPDGDVTRAPTTVGVSVALTVLALLCLTLRLYTRLRIVKAPAMDDLILTFTMFVIIIPNMICLGIQTKYGLGRHIYYLSEHERLMFLKWAYIGDTFGLLMNAVPKIAVVVFLHKCLGRIYRPSIYLLYAMVAILNVVTILNVIFLYVQCSPVDAPWTAGIKATCWDPRIFVYYSYFVGSSSAFTDLILALYPLTFVPQLQMGRKQKIATCCVMGMGVFACACAIARTTTLAASTYATDPTWESATLYVWAGAEANVVFICASVPAFVPLVLYKMRSRQGSSDTKASISQNLLRRSIREGTSFTSTVGPGETGEKQFDDQITATTEVSVQHGQP